MLTLVLLPQEAIEACDKLDEGKTNWRGGEGRFALLLAIQHQSHGASLIPPLLSRCLYSSRMCLFRTRDRSR